MTVNKTVSMPMSTIEAILDEGEVMQKDFSGTLVTLVRLGIMYRKDSEIREQEMLKRESEIRMNEQEKAKAAGVRY